MAFVGKLSEIKLLLGPLVIQLVWYISKELSTSAGSVKEVDIYFHKIIITITITMAMVMIKMPKTSSSANVLCW